MQLIRPSTATAMHVRRQVRVSSSGALHCRRLKPSTSTPIPSRSPSTALLPLGLPFTPLSHPVAVPQAWSSRFAGVLSVGKLNPTAATFIWLAATSLRPAGTSNCWGDAETAAAASPNPKLSAGFGVRLAPPRTTFDRLADRLGQNCSGRPPPSAYTPPRPDFCNTASDYDLTMVIACLNLQGFRKVDPDRWEFANEGFLRGQRHLLKMIKRRKPLPSNVPPAQQQALTSCLEVGEFGFEEEIDRLKRDKNILIAEVVKLRQEQQATKDHVQAMEERLQAAEQKQVQMMGFLARAMRNPEFFQQLVQQQDKRKELKDAISKKRRRPIENVPFYSPEETSQSKQLESPFLFDSGVLNELTEPGIPELENLALNIQEIGKGKADEERRDQANGQAELNDDFWAELLVADFEDKDGKSELDGRSTEDVDELAQQLGYLSSTCPK